MLMSALVSRAWIHSRMKLKKTNRKTRKIRAAMPATTIQSMLAFVMPPLAAGSLPGRTGPSSIRSRGVPFERYVWELSEVVQREKVTQPPIFA